MKLIGAMMNAIGSLFPGLSRGPESMESGRGTGRDGNSPSSEESAANAFASTLLQLLSGSSAPAPALAQGPTTGGASGQSGAGEAAETTEADGETGAIDGTVATHTVGDRRASAAASSATSSATNSATSSATNSATSAAPIAAAEAAGGGVQGRGLLSRGPGSGEARSRLPGEACPGRLSNGEGIRAQSGVGGGLPLP